MKNQYFNTEARVRVEMHAMGICEEQSLAIINVMLPTFEARAAARIKYRAVAAELVWLWATGLATSAEAVYKLETKK